METQNIMKIKLDLPKIHKKPITQTQKINLKLNHLLKTHNPNPKSKSKYKLNGGRTLENKWERINHVSFDREGFLQIFEIGACGGELIWPWDKEEKRKGRKRRRRWLCLTYGGEVIWSWEWKNEIKWNGKSWHRTRLDWAEATIAFVNSHLVFFFFSWTIAAKGWLFHGEQCTRTLFTDPQIPLFSNFFIKNGSHGTIHTFKNYFATMFSVSVFNFSKNKFNSKGPINGKGVEMRVKKWDQMKWDKDKRKRDKDNRKR